MKQRCIDFRIPRTSLIRVSSVRIGLSRVEVVCVVGVLSLLLAIGIPGVLSLRESSRRTSCQSNLRSLGIALNAYHDTHRVYPAAANWRTDKLHSLALHQSRRFDLFENGNWVQALLAYLQEEQGKSNTKLDAKQRLSVMSCAADAFNTSKNLFVFTPTERESFSYARGNYAMNAGSNSFDAGVGNTSFLTGDHSHLRVDPQHRTFEMWGNGMGGINVSFSQADFVNGSSHMIALEEVRAGVHALDPRGVWSLGQIGGSITWAHGVNGDAYGPNNQHPRSDDIINCPEIHETLGSKRILKLGMPCVSYIDQNFQATARSMHRIGGTGGVNVLLLDGSTKFLADSIDPGLWHILHSRETPQSVWDEKQESSSDDAQQAHMSTVSATSSTAHQSVQVSQDLDAEAPSILSAKNSLDMTFAKVPAAAYLMGRPDLGNSSDLPPEAPPHQVELTEGYYLSAYEVTRKQWQQLMEIKNQTGASSSPSSEQNFPITSITWNEANLFCDRLTALEEEVKAGRRYRLPTEAEWEFACRGGKDIAYEWHSQRPGNDESGETGGILPALPLGEVGRYPANELGLFDMRGNAWEWCRDWFSRDYYANSESQDPQGPNRGYFKVVRGNDWTFVGEGCKISYSTMPPWKSNPYCGFRVIMESGETLRLSRDPQ